MIAFPSFSEETYCCLVLRLKRTMVLLPSGILLWRIGQINAVFRQTVAEAISSSTSGAFRAISGRYWPPGTHQQHRHATRNRHPTFFAAAPVMAPDLLSVVPLRRYVKSYVCFTLFVGAGHVFTETPHFQVHFKVHFSHSTIGPS